MDIGIAEVDELIIHHVGNKTREEGVFVSSESTELTSDVASILLKNYLSAVSQKEDEYSFYHETELKFNEIRAYCEEHFSDEINFETCAERIAKHLYSKSSHPSIAGGEIFVVLFSKIISNNTECRAIGIFKTESKEKYLKVRKEGGRIILGGEDGIDPKNVQKGAIIVEENLNVYAIEKGSAKTRYWLDDFLKVKAKQNSKSVVKFMKGVIARTSDSLSDPIKIENYKNDFKKILNSEKVTIENIYSLGRKHVGDKKAAEINEAVGSSYSGGIPLNFEIQSIEIKKKIAPLFNRIRVHDNIDVVISGKSLAKVISKSISEDGRFCLIKIDMGENQ